MNAEDVSRLEAVVLEIERAGNVDEFGRIVRKYQGNATALTPQVVRGACETLLDFASTRLLRDAEWSGVYRDPGLDAACAAVYEMCVARGVKGTVCTLPHRATDLEAVALTLGRLDDDREAWRTRYTLLLWLAMLAKNPFDVASAAVEGAESVVRMVVAVCEASLRDSGPPREAAALCLASVVTRRDVADAEVEGLVARLASRVSDVTGDSPPHDAVWAATGSLAAVAAALKHGERQRSRAVAAAALAAVAPCFGDDRSKAVRPLRKLAVKVVGRCGCALLKPRVASWCYRRGRRTLLLGAGASASSAESLDANDGGDDDDGHVEDEASAELLEDVMDRLLEGTRDPETGTRWAAAKAVGRVAARLAQDVADDVVACVLEEARDGEAADARHGGCLALAELGRLGVLLPARLDDAIAALKSSMVFETRAASGAPVGAHVRDAACYAAWAFARAYEPDLIRPYVATIAQTVVPVALLDREVHVRRAAAAALQENVGRQGHARFPMGIELLRLADFFALGSREKAYLDVTPKIFRLSPIYATAIEDRLLTDRLTHWDADVRRLAAKALGEVVRNGARDDEERDALLERAARILAPRATCPTDVGARHGALLGLAEVVVARGLLKATRDDEQHHPERLAGLIVAIEAKRLYRGRGGELVRVAACRLIECLARCGAPVAVKTQLRMLDTLDDCACHVVEDVRGAAIAALRELGMTYFGRAAEVASERLLNRTVHTYIRLLDSAQNAAASRGLGRCVGALPARILCANDAVLDAALGCLCRRAHRDDVVAGDRDAETRREAISGLRELCASSFNPASRAPIVPLGPKRVRRVFETYIEACRDYGVDKRGDVGSWARAEAMVAAADLATLASRACLPIWPTPPSETTPASLKVPDLDERRRKFGDAERLPLSPAVDETLLWTPALAHSLISVLLRQLGDKLSVVRATAARVLRNVLSPDAVGLVPARPALVATLVIDDMDEDHDAAVFRGLASAMAAAPTYHAACLGGLAVTAGAFDSRASEAARQALVDAALGYRGSRGGARDAARLARSLVTVVDDVCAPKMKTKTAEMSTDDEDATHRCAATASALSREEAARAYLPVLRLGAAIVDSGAFTVLVDEEHARQASRTADDTDMDARHAIASDRAKPDDPQSIASVLVDTLARVALSRRCTTDVRKTCAVADALLATLSLCASAGPRNARKATAALVALLGLPLPRARAHIAEQLFARFVDVGLGSQTTFTPDQLGLGQSRLAQYAWDDDVPLADLIQRRDDLAATLGITEHHAKFAAILDRRHAPAPNTRPTDELESYAALVKDAGY